MDRFVMSQKLIKQWCAMCTPILFGMKVHSVVLSVLLCSSFEPHSNISWFLFLFLFHILFKQILNHTKFLQLNLIHASVYIGMCFHL